MGTRTEVPTEGVLARVCSNVQHGDGKCSFSGAPTDAITHTLLLLLSANSAPGQRRECAYAHVSRTQVAIELFPLHNQHDAHSCKRSCVHAAPSHLTCEELRQRRRLRHPGQYDEPSTVSAGTVRSNVSKAHIHTDERTRTIKTRTLEHC